MTTPPMNDPENRPWWWHNVSGSPRAWNASIPEDQRKTVYYLMLEKKP